MNEKEKGGEKEIKKRSRISVRLKSLRENMGLSQSQMEEKAGMSKSLISSYETGHRTPSYAALKTLAQFFNVSTDYIVYGEERKGLSKPERLYYIMVEMGLVEEGADYSEEEWANIEKIVRKAVKAAQLMMEDN